MSFIYPLLLSDSRGTLPASVFFSFSPNLADQSAKETKVSRASSLPPSNTGPPIVSVIYAADRNPLSLPDNRFVRMLPVLRSANDPRHRRNVTLVPPFFIILAVFPISSRTLYTAIKSEKHASSRPRSLRIPRFCPLCFYFSERVSLPSPSPDLFPSRPSERLTSLGKFTNKTYALARFSRPATYARLSSLASNCFALFETRPPIAFPTTRCTLVSFDDLRMRV